jgi:hypothetical protein
LTPAFVTLLRVQDASLEAAESREFDAQQRSYFLGTTAAAHEAMSLWRQRFGQWAPIDYWILPEYDYQSDAACWYMLASIPRSTFARSLSLVKLAIAMEFAPSISSRSSTPVAIARHLGDPAESPGTAGVAAASAVPGSVDAVADTVARFEDRNVIRGKTTHVGDFKQSSSEETATATALASSQETIDITVAYSPDPTSVSGSTIAEFKSDLSQPTFALAATRASNAAPSDGKRHSQNTLVASPQGHEVQNLLAPVGTSETGSRSTTSAGGAFVRLQAKCRAILSVLHCARLFPYDARLYIPMAERMFDCAFGQYRLDTGQPRAGEVRLPQPRFAHDSSRLSALAKMERFTWEHGVLARADALNFA